MDESSNNREFLAIKLFDLTPEEPLGFNLYLNLPANKKFIKYIEKFDFLSDEKIQNLKAKNIYDLYIKSEDFDVYKRRFASALKKRLEVAPNNEIKATIIKQEAKRILEAIDTLTSCEDALIWTQNCVDLTKGIVANLYDKKLANIFDNLKNLLSEEPSLVNHSLFVSSLSVIFSMALGFHENNVIEDIALAGLLHDIGLSKSPPELLKKVINQESLTDAELVEYRAHPLRGVEILIKQVKSPMITERVIRIVAEHHENGSSTGFPNKIPLVKKFHLAKILDVADRISFCFLKSDKTDLKYILGKMIKEQEPKEMREYDLNILKQILKSI